MQLFELVADTSIILRSNGVYRQAKVYRRGENLYAGHGSGFVRLLKMPGTSNPNILWDETDCEHKADRLGRPVYVAPQSDTQ